MKIAVLFYWVFFGYGQLAAQQNLFSGRYNKQALSELLVPQHNWTPFPKRTDRQAWAKADSALLKGFVAEAEKYLTYDWPAIPATTSLLIVRTGDRDEYQAISFQKRIVLGALLLAEIYENKGRFIDPIINGVWSICEESFWGASAHLPKTKEAAGLADVSQPFVELFSAETAAYLSWVDYFLGDRLDAVSPQIRKRIYYEINKRIFEPAMAKHHPWMGINAAGRRPNNWNPWICSNWLNAALLLEKDAGKRTAMVSKILTVLDAFTNPYPQDGGCDEGPSYWNAAAASLYDNIVLLNQATNNAFTYLYGEEKIKNMGRYIYRAQISDSYFINFADADPQPGLSPGMIYRFGKDIGDNDMMKLGAYYRNTAKNNPLRFHYFRNFYALFLQQEFQQAPQALPLPADVWLPDLQVMTARDKEGSTSGFFVAAKGGNNDESHNHNDVGSFLVYYDGFPLLIDAGRGTYTARTFSPKRYEIWYNRSDYHNLPTIRGYTQPAGAAFAASDVTYKKGSTFSQLSLQLAKAYPDSAGIRNWQRTVRLARGKSISITDDFSLQQAGAITEHLLTCYPVEVQKQGELVIHYAPAGGVKKAFVLRYNPHQLQPEIEKLALTGMEDKGIKEKWGDSVYRINLRTLVPVAKGKIALVLEEKK